MNLGRTDGPILIARTGVRSRVRLSALILKRARRHTQRLLRKQRMSCTRAVKPRSRYPKMMAWKNGRNMSVQHMPAMCRHGTPPRLLTDNLTASRISRVMPSELWTRRLTPGIWRSMRGTWTQKQPTERVGLLVQGQPPISGCRPAGCGRPVRPARRFSRPVTPQDILREKRLEGSGYWEPGRRRGCTRGSRRRSRPVRAGADDLGGDGGFR